ncbi:peptidoglycan bridge formation glycyltransferase FemA/FemB family protein, partial [candidate division WWE3 bacterium]|nr:peptidoglycan bridge formation glycyltransferase FemA/FemB family protein [candidate division WWE3 bacterium]
MHVVQSPMWAKFKTKMGTKSVIVSGSENKNTIIYTKHAIPLTGKFIAYCPKVDPKNIDWKLIESSLIQENCIAINFDVPNVESTKPQDQKVLHAIKTFQEKCVKSPKDTFAKANIILDISRSEEEILSSMHKKHRYNINYAQKQGVTVREGTTEKDFEIFFELLKKTADRQHYFIHPKN